MSLYVTRAPKWATISDGRPTFEEMPTGPLPIRHEKVEAPATDTA